MAIAMLVPMFERFHCSYLSLSLASIHGFDFSLSRSLAFSFGLAVGRVAGAALG